MPRLSICNTFEHHLHLTLNSLNSSKYVPILSPLASSFSNHEALKWFFPLDLEASLLSAIKETLKVMIYIFYYVQFTHMSAQVTSVKRNFATTFTEKSLTVFSYKIFVIYIRGFFRFELPLFNSSSRYLSRAF